MIHQNDIPESFTLSVLKVARFPTSMQETYRKLRNLVLWLHVAIAQLREIALVLHKHLVLTGVISPIVPL